MSLYTDYKFFRDHAGYVGGERAKGALKLAKAYQWAFDNDVEFLWAPDDSTPYEDALGDHEYWCDAAKHGKCRGHEVEQCVMYIDGECVASMGAIIDASRAYRKVIEAELALEVVP